MNPSPREEFQLNRLPHVDPEKEKQLVQFLEKPIDSREAVQTPLFSNKPKNVPVIPLKPAQKTVTMKGESKEELQKEWEKRFARFHVHNYKDNCCRSHSSPYYPSLAQRQVAPKSDPLNVLSIEEISSMRHHQVQGPAQQLSHLPQLRCLPTDLLSHGIRKR